MIPKHMERIVYCNSCALEFKLGQWPLREEGECHFCGEEGDMNIQVVRKDQLSSGGHNHDNEKEK